MRKTYPRKQINLLLFLFTNFSKSANNINQKFRFSGLYLNRKFSYFRRRTTNRLVGFTCGFFLKVALFVKSQQAKQASEQQQHFF